MKRAADGDGQLSEQIIIDCPAPSASGTFLITKATYDVGSNLGVFVFKNGQGAEARLNWIAAKFKDDDFTSGKVVGFEFGFTMPKAQFFITVMNNGIVKAGVNKNGTSGIEEITCKAVIHWLNQYFIQHNPLRRVFYVRSFYGVERQASGCVIPWRTI